MDRLDLCIAGHLSLLDLENNRGSEAHVDRLAILFGSMHILAGGIGSSYATFTSEKAMKVIQSAEMRGRKTKIWSILPSERHDLVHYLDDLSDFLSRFPEEKVSEVVQKCTEIIETANRKVKKHGKK